MTAKIPDNPDFPSGIVEVRPILGDQLNPNHSWFDAVDSDVLYLFVEAHSEQAYVRHHIQKTLTILGAMRRFAQSLREAGHQVHYVALDSSPRPKSIFEVLVRVVRGCEAERVQIQEPDEYRLDQELRQLRESLSAEVEFVSSEHFLTERTFVGQFFGKRKEWRMESFYRELRRRLGVLMDDDQPHGDKWNFDSDNRKKWPAKEEPPEPLLFSHDLRSIAAMLEEEGVETIGSINAGNHSWVLDRDEALQLLDYFVEHLLPKFGPLQDAMTKKGGALYHSRISQALNMKMLSPREVIETVERAYRAEPKRVPLQSAEGFIRQVLGWREYVRGVYWARMPGYAKQNALVARRHLPIWYWTGDTQMACLSHAIKQSLETGYAHHIQRLMVTGNFALLAGVHPDEVDEWYLGIYVDAFEWVEMPNTRGMSQWADGGFLASKPYAASANYMQKQGDYCKSCRYNPKEKLGDDACPLGSLYWDFYSRHRRRLEGHPRIGMAYRTWDRMAPTAKRALLDKARQVLANIDQL